LLTKFLVLLLGLLLLLLAQGALRVLPTSLVAERAVLQGLARHGSNACLTALQVGWIHKYIYIHIYM
jgi:hypothetical protein